MGTKSRASLSQLPRRIARRVLCLVIIERFLVKAARVRGPLLLGHLAHAVLEEVGVVRAVVLRVVLRVEERVVHLKRGVVAVLAVRLVVFLRGPYLMN